MTWRRWFAAAVIASIVLATLNVAGWGDAMGWTRVRR